MKGMRSLARRAVLGCSLLIGVPAHINISSAQSTAVTLGALFEHIEGVVRRLETSARSLLDQGNNIAAQQQLLLAGTLQGTVRQLQKAYADSLDKTFDRLDTTQANAFRQLQSTVDHVSILENQTAQHLQELVTGAQDAVNQVMDRMPLTDKSPVYFGIQTKDVLRSFDARPNDLVISGYHLVDSRLNNKPPDIVVAVNGKLFTIPPRNISASFRKVEVSLPEELKNIIKIENQPCEPMQLFHVTGNVHYKGGFFNTERAFAFNANVSPGERMYAIHVTIEGNRVATEPVQSSFTNSSSSIEVGCEETKSTTVAYTAPEEARQLNGQAAWVDANNIKSDSHNAVPNGNVITATGTITGLDTVCIGLFGACAAKNCPGGGHARLVLSGTYVVNQAVSRPFHDERDGVHTNPTHISIPSDTLLKLSAVDVRITRRGCARVLDTIHISVPSDASRIVQASSAQGLFTSVLQPGQLEIRSSRLI